MGISQKLLRDPENGVSEFLSSSMEIRSFIRYAFLIQELIKKNYEGENWEFSMRFEAF